MEPTALPAPTDSWQPTANSIASLKATRPGRPSMNASGSSRAASSDETAAKTAGWSTDPDQSALRHQRGGDNPRSGVGGLPSPGFHTLLSGSGHGIRALSRSLTADSEEELDFCGVAHKGSALKVSRGPNFCFSGDSIGHERRVPTSSTGQPVPWYTRATNIGLSGSGIAQPVSPQKRFTVLQDETPGFQCGRVHTGVEHRQPSPMHSHTQRPRCKQSLYRPGLRKEHPGQASGADRLNRPVSSSESANTSPGVPAYPGTPINTPGENGRFGPDHGPPRPSPPDQRAATEEYEEAPASRAPSLLAFPLPKAQDAARFSAATSGPITASNLTENDATSSQSLHQNLHQTQSGMITRLAKAVVSNLPFLRATPCSTPREETEAAKSEEIDCEKGTIPSGFTVSEGRYPGQFSNFGPGSTAASHAAREPTTGNVQQNPNSRANHVGNSLSSAAKNLHPSNDESAVDNPHLDFSVPPKNPKS